MTNVKRLIGTLGCVAFAVTVGMSAAKAQVWSTNNIKQNMTGGQPIVGKRLDVADAATYCKLASDNGTDFVWTDMVHSGMEFGYVSTMWTTPCTASVAKMRTAEITFQKVINFITKAYYRPPDPLADAMQPKEMQRATDSGAMVIIIGVNNAAQAKSVVDRAYYPPVGHRDLGIGEYDALYPEAAAAGGYVKSYNDNVTVIASISTIEGVSQANAIAAVKGINALSIDTMNMESESGYPMGSPDYQKLDQAIRDAAKANQKYLCVTDRKVTPNALSCTKG